MAVKCLQTFNVCRANFGIRTVSRIGATLNIFSFVDIKSGIRLSFLLARLNSNSLRMTSPVGQPQEEFARALTFPRNTNPKWKARYG